MKINDYKRDTGLLSYIWKYLWTPLNIIVAFLPLCFLNLLQFPSLLLLPFSKNAFRIYNRAMAFLVWGWWAYGVRKYVGLKVQFYGERPERGENAILIANHQGMGDILVILCLAFDYGRVGCVKWMAKDNLKYVPGLGWGMLFLECIYLKRNWAADEESIRKTFANFRNDNVPIWLISFPEGTRYKSSKSIKSNEFAKTQNELPMENVLFPRTKGFSASVFGLEGHITSIYSLTIGYEENKTPMLLSLMRGDIKHVHLHVRKFSVTALPKGQVELGQWLTNEFRIKDDLLKGFKQNGKFPDPWSQV